MILSKKYLLSALVAMIVINGILAFGLLTKSPDCTHTISQSDIVIERLKEAWRNEQ